MVKTQSEKIDELITAVELLTAQQRIIISQHDKILEFVDAIYTGMAQQVEEPAPPATHSAQDAMAMLKDLAGGDGKPDNPNRASTSWGRNGD